MKKLLPLLHASIYTALIVASVFFSHTSYFSKLTSIKVANAQQDCSVTGTSGCPCSTDGLYGDTYPDCYANECDFDPTASGCACPNGEYGTEPTCYTNECDWQPDATGCPCVNGYNGTEPNCSTVECYDPTNPDCVNYDYCTAYPYSDQCQQNCNNTTYYNNNLAECGTCADEAYAQAHPEECNDIYYCCDECSPGDPSYYNTNYEADKDKERSPYCESSMCTSGATICGTIPPPPVQGCTDNTAANYDPNATYDSVPTSCYWNASCIATSTFDVTYSGVSPSVNYYGGFQIAYSWSDWPSQPDTTYCYNVAHSGTPDAYITENAPNLSVGSYCSDACTILDISHGDSCPAGEIRNSSDQCVSQQQDCLNNGGVWTNDQCDLTQASCGSAVNNQPSTTPPSSNLCSAGNASSVTTSTDGASFIWTCSSLDGSNTTNCSSAQCPSTGCVIASTCGSANNSTVTATPTTNLCQSGNTASNVSLSGNTYSWTCSDDTTNTLSGTCSATKASVCTGNDVPCNGVCVTGGTCSGNGNGGNGGNGTGNNGNTASTTLITSFTIIPHFVASSTDPTDLCTATWSASIPSGGCAINNTSVSSSGSIGEHPGTYTLQCQTGNDFQIKTAKCELNPKVLEK